MAIKVFTVAEMVAAERAADAAGVSYDEMMETAGRRVAEAIIERMPVSRSPGLDSGWPGQQWRGWPGGGPLSGGGRGGCGFLPL